MDITLLRKNDKFLGAYLAPQGLLLDAGEGVGEVIKELGLNPLSAILTCVTGDLVSGLEEVFPEVGNAGLMLPKVGDDTTIEKFSVGTKGAKRYGYRIKTPDGELVYAPQFDRLEKARIAHADVAILDPGDRGDSNDPAGASHRSFEARKRMAENAGVKNVLWIDESETSVELAVKVFKKVNDAEKAKMKDGHPSSDFLVVEDANDTATWHMPVYDAEHMGAAWAALHEGFRGNKYEGPNKSEAIKKLTAMYKKMGKPTPGEKKMMKSMDLTGMVEMVRMAFSRQFSGKPGYFHVERVYDDHVIVCDGYGMDGKTYVVNYSQKDDEYTFDEMTQWQEVKMEMVYQPVEKSELLVEKSDDGTYQWTAISSNSFRDTDGEVVSTQAMDFAIEIAKKRGSYGNLVWEHFDELPIGVCKSQQRVGNFLVETGTFLDTPLGQKAAEKIKSAEPGKYRISIGFKYWQGTKSDDGEYSIIDIFHRACTDHPANKGTALEVNKSMKQLTDEVKATVMKDLGLTQEELDAVLKAVTPAKEEIKSEETKTALKSEEVAVETPDLGATVAALSEKVKALEAQLATVPTVTRDEIMKSLAGAPKGDITKTTEKGVELTEDEKNKLAADLEANKSKDTPAPGGFQSFYDMFTSKKA
jgi:hypothetical protein